MKKKVLLCDKHGTILFRCKRKCWKAGERFYSEYKEECFKCISEDRYTKAKLTKEKIKHFSL